MGSKTEKLEENQQEILQTINNGLKSKVKENSKRMDKLTDRFNKFLWVIIGGMGTVIMFLIGILWQLAQMGGS